MELLLLSHLPTRILEEGFIPAAIELDLKVTVLTDCIREHLVRAGAVPVYRECKFIECDIFNPISIARLISVYGLEFSGVLATGSELRACAALIAEYMGLAGPSWSGALLCDQKSMLRNRVEPDCSRGYCRIVNCSESGPDADIEDTSFPLTVQPLESGSTTGGRLVRNRQDLKRCLAGIGGGYALVEEYLEGERYALDVFGTADDLAVLCGSRIHVHDSDSRIGRIQSFMEKPPRCDELLALLSGLNQVTKCGKKCGLGLGRHHVEYLLTDKGIRITDIHNGLQDDMSEFVINGQFDADLFQEAIKACLGLPVAPLNRVHTAELAWLAVPASENTSRMPAAFESMTRDGYRICFRPSQGPGSLMDEHMDALSVTGPDRQRAKDLLHETIGDVFDTPCVKPVREVVA